MNFDTRVARLEARHAARTGSLSPADRAAYHRLLDEHPNALAAAHAAIIGGPLRVALTAGQPGIPARVALAAWAVADGDVFTAIDRALREAGL